MSTSSAGVTGLPIDQLITPKTTAPPAASSVGSQLGEDAFLKLLTTQLQNQNPLSPMDDTQSIAQLAQFSAVQSTNELKSSFESFQSTFAVMQSASLVGQKVSVSIPDGNGGSSTVSGTVGQIEVIDGKPEFTLLNPAGKAYTDRNGQTVLFPTQQLVGIGG